VSEQASRVQKGRQQIRAKLQHLRVPQSGMFGPAEIIGLGASALVIILVIISYLYFLVPARSNRELSRLERSRLQDMLANSKKVVHEGETTETTVRAITDSLDGFETGQLSGRNQGRMDLYSELNEMIRRNALRNTSGPNYTVLDPSGSKANSTATKSASSKWQSVFPGIAISVTLEGNYANLRRFIRDIEASKQFVIINGVELERAETNSSAATEEAAAQRAALVSLRIEMATYFQRGADASSAAGMAQ
jgi:hypothetical protein